jgi:EmrB/QacA subfamily drug resistance transporter
VPRPLGRFVVVGAGSLRSAALELAPSASDRRWTLAAVCTTTFMLLLDITVVNVALPNIQQDLDASLTGLQWVVDAYALTLAALILTAGALADRYGRRLLFMVGVVIFTLSSLTCGLAWNIAVLDVSRAVQGVGGAALFATALALIGAEYGGPDIGGAIAVWGATIGVAVASGPLVGGILTDALDWRWVFFVNVPVGAFALFVAMTRMRESRDPQATRTDVWGLLTFSVSLFLIVFGVLRGNAEGWSSAQILGSLIGGGVLLAAFVVVEHRQARPMLELDLFSHPGFVGVSIATFCIGAGMFALFPYLSIYLQNVLGYSPLGAGLRFLPLTVFVFVVPLVKQKLAPGASLRWLLAGGLALVAIALVLMYGLTPSSSWTALLPGLIISGIGIGLANPAIAQAALRAVDPSRTGMASGINNACRLTGVAVGVAALGAVLEDRISTSLVSSLGPRGDALASAVAATGNRVALSNPSLAHPATVAYVSGLNTTLLVSCAIVAVGALAAGLLMRS